MYNSLSKDNSWLPYLKNEFNQPYFQNIENTLLQQQDEQVILPNPNDRLKAFSYTPYDKVNVVIVGQDPYHGLGQANGLAFSLNKGCKITPSLRNIFKELQDDLGIDHFNNVCLDGWARQGVFLINSILTVKLGQPLSHENIGWETFYQHTIQYLNDRQDPIIFVLWGKKAQSAKQLIDSNIHFVIESNHPSPLSASRGFFGSKPFSQINNLLIKQGKEPIDFSL